MAEALRVLDGDTFEARVRVWPGFDVTTRVRLRGIDAPEMRARCREDWRNRQGRANKMGLRSAPFGRTAPVSRNHARLLITRLLITR